MCEGKEEVVGRKHMFFEIKKGSSREEVRRVAC